MVPAMTPIKDSKLIHNWLQARQELIVLLNQLCNLRPFAQADQSQLWDTLQEFCLLVVDYLSLGHFEVYEHLSPKSAQEGFPNFTHLLHELKNATVKTLEFNDKYQNQLDIYNLDQDLSKLAFHITQRFEWEDELYHSSKY